MEKTTSNIPGLVLNIIKKIKSKDFNIQDEIRNFEIISNDPNIFNIPEIAELSFILEKELSDNTLNRSETRCAKRLLSLIPEEVKECYYQILDEELGDIIFNDRNLQFIEDCFDQNKYITYNNSKIISQIISKYFSIVLKLATLNQENKEETLESIHLRNNIVKDYIYYDYLMDLIIVHAYKTNQIVKYKELIQLQSKVINKISKLYDDIEKFNKDTYLKNVYKIFKYKINARLTDNHKELINDLEKRGSSDKNSNYLIFSDNDEQMDIITIDGENTQLFEDAIAIKEREDYFDLMVYISDIRDIYRDSNLINEIYKAGDSIYLNSQISNNNNLIFSMIDPHISQKYSLIEDNIRPVLEYNLKIDKSGKLLDVVLKRKVLKIKYNLTTEIYNFINNAKELEVVITLQKLNKILDSNNLTDIYSQNDIIKNTSLLLNNYMARLCYKKNIPIIYRNLVLKDYKVLHPPIPQPFYSKESYGHYGLGFDHYTQVTSPLRRLADFVNNFVINGYILGEDFDKKQIGTLVDLSSESLSKDIVKSKIYRKRLEKDNEKN